MSNAWVWWLRRLEQDEINQLNGSSRAWYGQRSVNRDERLDESYQSHGRTTWRLQGDPRYRLLLLLQKQYQCHILESFGSWKRASCARRVLDEMSSRSGKLSLPSISSRVSTFNYEKTKYLAVLKMEEALVQGIFCKKLATSSWSSEMTCRKRVERGYLNRERWTMPLSCSPTQNRPLWSYTAWPRKSSISEEVTKGVSRCEIY